MSDPWVATPAFFGGEYPPSADFNTLSQDLRFLQQRKGVRLHRDGAWSALNNAIDVLAWDAADWDPLTMWNPLGDRSQLVVPVGYDGVWDIVAAISWAADPNGARTIYITQNGSGNVVGRSDVASASATGGTAQHAHARVAAAAGDTFVIYRNQTSGGTLAGGVGTGSTWVEAEWVSA